MLKSRPCHSGYLCIFCLVFLQNLGSNLSLFSCWVALVWTPTGAVPLYSSLVKLPLVRKLGKWAAPMLFQSQVPADSNCCWWGQRSFGDHRKFSPAACGWVWTHEQDRTELSVKEVSFQWAIQNGNQSVEHQGLAQFPLCRSKVVKKKEGTYLRENNVLPSLLSTSSLQHCL